MMIFGGILLVLVVLLCLTVIGSVIGIPLILIGGIFMSIGIFSRRKTVITNVVQVSSAPQVVPPAPASRFSARPKLN